jgi:F-type H+-transporting ATPase subunit a
MSAGAESTGASLEVLNFVQVVVHYLGDVPLAHFLHRFENEIFQGIVIGFLGLIFYLAQKDPQRIPGRLAAACEAVVEGLSGFVCGILGPDGKKHVPFLGTVFLYILCMNLIGLIPLMKSPTSSSMILSIGPVTIPVPMVTLSLGILVFGYVQAVGIKEQGIGGYLDHLAGSPRDAIGFCMVPLMLPIHVIGELVKPFSLAYRLFSNIMGEDVLLAVFLGLGVGMAFIPLHAPFLFLALLTGTIQAFVFMLLSTVYIAMVLPHRHEEEAHHPAGA